MVHMSRGTLLYKVFDVAVLNFISILWDELTFRAIAIMTGFYVVVRVVSF